MALIASKNIMERYTPGAYRDDIVGTPAVQYFRGGLVGVDNTSGLLVKLTNAMTVRSVFVCEDETLAVAGDFIGVRDGIFKFVNGDSIVGTDEGKLAYIGASDDTVIKGGAVATDAVVGTIEGVDAATAPGGAGVWVKVRGNHEYLQSAVGVSGA